MFQRQWKQAQRPRKNVAKARVSAAKRAAARKKPVWDNTVSDLTVHQLSKEEMELRRSRILSKNADRARRELEEIAKGTRQLSSAGSHRSSSVAKTSGAQDKEQLHSILEESDRALSVVKDLFGDDPKRYSGQPNVTVAPHVTMDRAALQRTLLESQQDGPTPSALNSPGGIRDESVFGLAPIKPALNDLPSPSSEFTIDESNFEISSLQLSPPVSPYQPVVVDLPRFQRLVEQCGESGERVESGMEEKGGGGVGEKKHAEELSSIAGSQQGGDNVTIDSNLDSAEGGGCESRDLTSGQPLNMVAFQKQHHPLQIVHKMPNSQTAHLTSSTSGSSTVLAGPPMQQPTSSVSRNQRLRRLPPGRAASAGAASNGIHDDLSVLQKLVQDLEKELQEYEQTSGYCFPVKKPAATQSGTFTSLTVSLLASVTKLTHYLKQSEVQLKGEVAVRNQLLHAMAEQQNLMDALTADVVKLQEENSSLKSGLQKLEQSTSGQAKTLQEDVLELRKKVCALEQIKPFPVKDSPTASLGSGGEPLSSWMTSPAAVLARAPPPPQTEDAEGTNPTLSINTVSPSHSPAEVNLSSLGEPSVAIMNTNLNVGITPAAVSSMKPPVTYYNPHPWSFTSTQPDMQSTPAFYHTPIGVEGGLTKHSLHLPFTPTPLSVAPSLSVAGVTPGLSRVTISPSDLDVSHLSFTSQVPPVSLPPSTLPFQPVPPPSSLPFHHHPPPNPSVQLLPSISRQPLAPLPLPYSWEAPVTTSASVGFGTVYTLPPSTSIAMVPSASSTNPKVTVSTSQRRTLAPLMTLPDLSLSASSLLPAPGAASKPHEVSPSQSESSLDIEASLARMSSLARSVLQELAQDRGHLLSASQPPHSYSTPLPVSTPRVPSVESVDSMTTVSSLDSEPPSLESSATQDSSLSHNLPRLAAVSSNKKEPPTSIPTK